MSMVLLFSFAGCGSGQELPKADITLFSMNTYMTFTAYGEQAQTALDESKTLIERLESL